MPIETLNLELFSLINASAEVKPWIIHLAIFIANDLLYLVLGLLVFLWCFGDLANKERALRAVLLTSIALGVGYLISLYYPHSRPFVLGVGHTLIEHSATASFPSNHMLIFSTIALSYLSVGRRVAGGILLLMAFAVAWSRIYIGVHFPLDMLGAFGVALAINSLGVYIWPLCQSHIMHMAVAVYSWLFHPLLRRGWLK
jgi:undecaprenyl-diphosphatase